MNKNKIGLYLLLSVFILSAMEKIFRFEANINKIKTKMSVNTQLASIFIFSAIVIQFMAPYMIITNNMYKPHAYTSLILFTIAATLMFHFPPLKPAKYYPFISNMSLLGGLISAQACL